MITRSGLTRSITGGHQRTPHRGAMTGLAAMGRHGDTMLAHVNPEEAQLLKAHGGSGTVNPMTGLPEFSFGSDTPGGPADFGGESGSSFGGSSSGIGGGQDSDIFGQQQAFNDALQAFRDTGSVYTGPAPGLGGTVDQNRLNRSDPTLKQNAFSYVQGAAIPFGVDVHAERNYLEGRPDKVTTINPIGAFANMVMGPMGDRMGPDWADIEIHRGPFGEPQHSAHTGVGAESGGASHRNAVQDQLDSLIRSVLQEPHRDTRAEAPAKPSPPQKYTAFTGDPTRYGQPGGAPGHAFFTS